MGASGLAVGSLTVGSQYSFASEPVSLPQAIDPLSLLDPELIPVAKQMQQRSASMVLSDEFIARARKGGGPPPPKPLPNVPFLERRVPVSGGAPDVRVLIVNSDPGVSRPVIVHTHGGGFISGSVDQSLPDLQTLASALDCIVVTVDYRLAPETRYIGSIEDTYAALLWSYKNAAELGIDVRQIAVFGESAGGGHAAWLALTARDRGEVPIAFQALIYPMLDDRTGSTRRVAPHIGTIGWNAASNRYGWRAFLGQEPGTQTVPTRAVPARTRELSRLPATFIGVGSLDLFALEDIEYATRLLTAGVAVELLVVPGAFHGFDVIGRDDLLVEFRTS